jgi:PKD repeat protein
VKYGYECCTVPTVANFTAVVPNGKVGYFTFTGTSPYDSLIWNFGDGATDTTKNPSHVYSVSDTYTVCVTVYSECGTDTKCQKVVITVGVEDLAMSTISIYPNPFTGLLTIEGAEAGTKIALLNMLGQQLYNGTISSTKETINTSQLPAGNYILHLTDTAGERKSIKLTKD